MLSYDLTVYRNDMNLLKRYLSMNYIVFMIIVTKAKTTPS